MNLKSEALPPSKICGSVSARASLRSRLCWAARTAVLAPELIFDQFVGDVFVVRRPATLRNHRPTSAASSSVTRVLKSKAIVVLGHSSCGAVQSAFEGAKPGETFRPSSTRSSLESPARPMSTMRSFATCAPSVKRCAAVASSQGCRRRALSRSSARSTTSSQLLCASCRTRRVDSVRT